MSAQPRTLRYFPRMRVRDAKRRQQAWAQRFLRANDLLVVATADASDSIRKFAQAMNMEATDD